MNSFRRVNILFVVLLLSCCWIYAQTSSHSGPQPGHNPDQGDTAAQQSGSATGEVGSPNGVTSHNNGSAKTSSKVSVEGCLINSNGNYTLVDKDGSCQPAGKGLRETAGRLGDEYSGHQQRCHWRLHGNRHHQW